MAKIPWLCYHPKNSYVFWRILGTRQLLFRRSSFLSGTVDTSNPEDRRRSVAVLGFQTQCHGTFCSWFRTTARSVQNAFSMIFGLLSETKHRFSKKSEIRTKIMVESNGRSHFRFSRSLGLALNHPRDLQICMRRIRITRNSHGKELKDHALY